MSGAAGAAAARHPRSDARHSLAADPLRAATCSPRATLLDAARRARSATCPTVDEHRGADAHRAPAAVVGRPGDAAGDRQVHRVVRKDAPWCPSNIEFIRRINGLRAATTCAASCSTPATWCSGLGDVYLGAPVATPLDPRHRLVTTKYNPARTWTPENAVGIGGAYMCIYGMEGPGGYQFVGRTLQVWNTYRRRASSSRQAVAAALLRSDPLLSGRGRRAVAHARGLSCRASSRSQIERETFRFGDYRRMLEQNAESIAAFKRTQSAAFLEERERWAAQGQDVVSARSAPSRNAARCRCPISRPACARSPARSRAICGRCWSSPASACRPARSSRSSKR